MTVLNVCEDVATEIGITVPTVVFGGTDRELVELQTLANKMAKRILRLHEWELLATVSTYTGDGAALSFSLPSDYDRMPKKTQLWSSTLEAPMTKINSFNRWLDLDVRSYDFVFNAWILIGGKVEIKPAMATAVTAKHYYVSNLIVTPTGAPPDTAVFAADSDVFRLSEELLTLGMIWQWKKTKGRPYAEDLADYEELKEKLIVEDKGSKIIIVGQRRIPKGARTAYPQTITA